MTWLRLGVPAEVFIQTNWVSVANAPVKQQAGKMKVARDTGQCFVNERKHRTLSASLDRYRTQSTSRKVTFQTKVSTTTLRPKLFRLTPLTSC